MLAMMFDCSVVHEASGRLMEVYSNQPGVQFYTSNGISERPNEDSKTDILRGKSNCSYFRHAAFCLETQNYPDAINHVSITIMYRTLLVPIYFTGKLPKGGINPI